MVLSVSRRTDIPAYFSEWFYNRIKEGFFYVKNPMNPRQVSKINLSRETVDGMVFWTKNPKPMLAGLEGLHDYPYYFQFTLTGYGKDVEPNLPDKEKELIPTFLRLSERIGSERVIWRYDPVFLNGNYTPAYHLKAFEYFASRLAGHTQKVIISFLDFYGKTRRNMKGLSVREASDGELRRLAEQLAKIAVKYQLSIETCGEQMDLRDVGISHGSCIDKILIQKITGHEIKGKKDRNQRKECGCMESVDAGTYHTCQNGCKYCYANFSSQRVADSIRLYDVDSPLLCQTLGPKDRIRERIR